MQDIVRVDLSERSYDIVIGPGAIRQAGARIAPLIGRRPVIIVTDDTVAPLHLPALESSVLVLFFALPTAPTAYVLTRQLGGDGHLMAGIITLQTLLAAASLPLVLTLLNG